MSQRQCHDAWSTSDIEQPSLPIERQDPPQRIRNVQALSRSGETPPFAARCTSIAPPQRGSACTPSTVSPGMYR